MRSARSTNAIAMTDPVSGRPLDSDQPWSLSDGETRWPIVDGIPFLRVNRDSLRREVLAALDSGDQPRALIALLADQDDFARIAPPDVSTLNDLIDSVNSGRATFRAAMVALRFGPVADYFAFRWSSPTYLSGLALLDRFGGDTSNGPVLEVACGVGHYLRDLAIRGRDCAGIDVVFSKLWLARRFLVPIGVPLICADVSAGFPLTPMTFGGVAFCHDAFYFLPEKPTLIANLRRTVGPAGRIVIGHAHNRNFDHRGVSGEPKTPGEYAELLPGCTLFDDAELARSVWSDTPAHRRLVDELARVEAIAMVWPPKEPDGTGSRSEAPSLLDPIPGAQLRLNSLLVDEAGTLRPNWPSAQFEAEYADASGYLIGEPAPSEATVDSARLGAAGLGTNAEVDRLARRRIFLDLPERW